MNGFEEFSDDEKVTAFLKEIFAYEDRGLFQYRDLYKELVEKYYR